MTEFTDGKGEFSVDLPDAREWKFDRIRWSRKGLDHEDPLVSLEFEAVVTPVLQPGVFAEIVVREKSVTR